MTSPTTITGLPRVRVGSILRAADGRRFIVKSIRRKQFDDEEELQHQCNAAQRRQPRLNSGLSYARSRVDEKGPA